MHALLAADILFHSGAPLPNDALLAADMLYSLLTYFFTQVPLETRRLFSENDERKKAVAGAFRQELLKKMPGNSKLLTCFTCC